MHEVLVNRLGGLSLPRKSVVRLTDMTLDVYRGRKTTIQQRNEKKNIVAALPTHTIKPVFGDFCLVCETVSSRFTHEDEYKLRLP